MTPSLVELAQRLSGAELSGEVRALLVDEGTCIRESSGGVSTADYEAKLWKLRADVNAGTSHPLLGSELLLKAFETLAPEQKIERITAEDASHVAIFFFTSPERQALGYVAIRHRTPGEEQSRLEHLDRLFGRSAESTLQEVNAA